MTPSARVASTRVLGLDAVRGLAILAMVFAHVMPFTRDGLPRPVNVIATQVSDLASPLFGLVMGVSAGLVWQRPQNRTRPGAVSRVGNDIARGLVIFGIGMALSALHTWIAIVLQVLGMLMVLGLPFVRMPTPVLIAVTAFAVAAMPTITGELAPLAARDNNGVGGLGDQVRESFSHGVSYRALSLLPLYLIGVVLARLGLTRRAAALGVTAAGVACLLVWAGGHQAGFESRLSGDWPDQVHDLGLACTACGLVMAYALVRGRDVLLTALASLGVLALTAYVGHVLLLKWLMATTQWWPTPLRGALLGAAVIAVVWAFALAWDRYLGAGPVERLVAMLTGRRISR